MAGKNAFNSQIEEHEAVRAAIRQVDERYRRRSRETPLSSDAVRNLRWQLFYLLEGVTGHFTRDETVVFPQVKSPIRQALETEHEAIRAEAESALALITAMAEAGQTAEDLARDTSALGQMIHRVRELIDTHTAREDAILLEAVKQGRSAEAPPGIEFQVH